AEDVEIFGPVAADLAGVEAALRNGIRHDPDEVGAPMADLFAAGGKRVRPALVLLSARCGSYDLDQLTPAAMAVELTHAATLVHDDVIDRSPVRRGRPTVAASLGDEPAIVIGDFYFAKAYEHAARTDSTEVVGILAQAVMEICAGEVRQQSIRYRYSTGVDEYMQRIESKTATLLAACCDIGAALAGVPPGQRSALHEYGRMLGLAFQIADDVLDYLGSEGEIGKPIGKDIIEGFATLPLMMAMEDAPVANQLEKVLVDGRELSAEEARDVVEIVRRSGAPQRALERAQQYASAASRRLDAIEAADVRDALAALAGYVVSRKL
ncbi:MAG TPA: polyprenyl synthetase family protein, partial [Candidatus Dormibacteraeota bacterium]|nr:polyprenyl synthetase family protein [Candidatus Dormibacteraeota bacterium]